MKATIELYEPLFDHLKTVDRHGRLKAHKWVVKFGPVVKICPSEKSAANYLYKMGFRMNDNAEYVLTCRSDDQIDLDRFYRNALSPRYIQAKATHFADMMKLSKALEEK